jgi:hypothetical protein
VRSKALAALSLFTSSGTLLCCALPTLLVALGLGAVVAGAVSSVPGLAALTRHKTWVFLTAGLLLGLNWALEFRRPAPACPADGGASACETAGRFSRMALWVSTVLFLIGATMAYLAFPLAERLGWV